MGWRLTRTALLLPMVLLLFAAAASAKSYAADRFDAVIRILDDGTLDVTETVVFRFEEGTFTEVFREIPARRTDGIEVLSASLQGEPLPFGTEAGTVEVRRQNSRVRVVWRFRPTEGVTRTFVLNYRVRGVVRQEGGADMLAWRATPGEHRYHIASSTIRFEAPAAAIGAPVVTTRKTSPARVTVADRAITIETSDIRPNGWVDTTVQFPRGAVIDAPPAWQQRATQIAAHAATWMIAAATVAAAGLILLIAWRQSYDAPPRDLEGLRDTAHSMRPDDLPPAIAGVIGANGRPGLEHAMAALFSLAERGGVEIKELPRGTFGQRDFVVTRRPGPVSVSPDEQAVLDTIFRDAPADSSTVTLSKARSRLSLRPNKFAKAIHQALVSHGFIDESRKAIRDRYHAAAIWLAVTGAIAFAPAALLVREHGAWPMLIPVAILLLALGSVIFGSTVTPLSNDAVRRARRWRDYKQHLTVMADGKHPVPSASSTLLPFAVAFGLAGAWSKMLQQQSQAAPAWFHALERHDSGAFAAFIGAGGSAATGGAGGGGGAAGGGSSGAG